MTNFSELRVFLCMTPTSMNFSFDRLMGLAERIFNQEPPGALLGVHWRAISLFGVRLHRESRP